MSSLSAGWYKDPADPSTQRWWDGEGWLGKAIPADQTPPEGPPPAEEPEPEPAAVAGETPVTPATPPAPSTPVGQGPPPIQGPPPGWGAPPPGWQPPPPGWQQPPPGWQPPPGYPAPQGWQPPPPGWQQPPPGWQPPPGYPPFPFPYAVRARPHGLALAGLGRRLVARLIDIAVVFLLNVLVNGWLAYQWWLEVEPIVRSGDPLAASEAASARSGYLILTMLFLATALWFAYEVPATGNSGQTLGKRLLGIKVVKLEDPTPLGFGRAFRRWSRLGMWTPLWNCAGIGLLAQLIYTGSVLFDQKLQQSLYDKAAGTVVVAAPPNQPQPDTTARPVNENDPTGGTR